jgi:D-alanyl-D-alanine carboxypeptidase
MLNTNLVNPHGLSNLSSFSTANDLAKLCTFGMKN